MTTRPILGESLSFACTQLIATPDRPMLNCPAQVLAATTIADRDPARARRLTQGLRPEGFQIQTIGVASAAASLSLPSTPITPPSTEAAALPEPAREPRSGYRRNSIFHMHGQFDWRILDRNQRAKLWSVAQSMERITKQRGDRNGCLGAIGLTVLNCLLYRFLNANSGRCDPSYDTLQRLTGLCRQSISTAIDRLEASGLVTVTRRMMRFKERVVCALTGRQHEVIVVRQISNAYVLTDPACIAIPSRTAPKPSRAFPIRRAMSRLETTLADLFEKIAGPSLSGRGKLKQPTQHPLATRYEVHTRS
jgi:hypothetical protein